MNGRQFIYHMQGSDQDLPGNRKVLENINLSFYPDAKIGVLGVNGSGKSTLLRIMAGIDKDFVGEGWVAEGARVGYLEQEPQLDAELSVRENVMEGVAAKKALLDRYNEIAANYSDETAEEMAKLQDKIDSKNLWDLDSQVDLAMDALRCPPDDADVTKLSGGERRRVALCRLLLDQPDLLLLDEPTNHLDAELVNWLEGHLRDYPGAILIVTHDRYFLDNVTGWILELDRGRGIPYEGNYSAWLVQKQKRLEQEGREEAARQRTLAARAGMDPRVAQGAAGEVQGALSSATRNCSSRRTRSRPQTAQIVIPVAERLGQNVVDFDGPAEGLWRQAADRRPHLQAAARRHRRRDRAERRRQDHAVPHDHRAGEAGRRHDQGRRVGAARLCRPVARCARRQEERLGGNLRRAGHHPARQAGGEHRAPMSRRSTSRAPTSRRRSAQLSGGERNRVHLAKMLKSGANVLLLDEPTNDLDVDTLRALEEALEDFAGCAVIISHDRWFLDRIATHILAFEGDSHVEWFEGNFQDYEKDKMRRLGEDSVMPKRIKYKKFSR